MYELEKQPLKPIYPYNPLTARCLEWNFFENKACACVRKLKLEV